MPGMQFHERERERVTVLIIVSENELFACRILEQQRSGSRFVLPSEDRFLRSTLFLFFSFPLPLLFSSLLFLFLAFQIRPFPPRRGKRFASIGLDLLASSDVTRGVAR